MFEAKQGKALVVKVPNEIGVLYRLAELVADKGINIMASCNWVEGDMGVMQLITDDNRRAAEEMQKNGYEPVTLDVVVVESANRPGLLKHVTGRLRREGLDIDYLYATASLKDPDCLVVLSTKNNERAIVLLND